MTTALYHTLMRHAAADKGNMLPMQAAESNKRHSNISSAGTRALKDQ